MTTDELVTTVLNYPCFIDIIFYDIYQEEFEIVRDNSCLIFRLFKAFNNYYILLSKYGQDCINTKFITVSSPL